MEAETAKNQEFTTDNEKINRKNGVQVNTFTPWRGVAPPLRQI